MPLRRLLLAAALLVLVAGCGGGADDDAVATAGRTAAPKATSSAKPATLTEQERALKFGKCMRANGVPNFPDPKVDGERVQLSLPQGIDKEKVDAAMAKCKEYLPGGGTRPKADPKRLAQMRKLAKCMRENGVPNFPDPSADGGIRVDGNKLAIDPKDPKFVAAEKACKRYQPPGPAGGPGTGRSDG